MTPKWNPNMAAAPREPAPVDEGFGPPVLILYELRLFTDDELEDLESSAPPTGEVIGYFAGIRRWWRAGERWYTDFSDKFEEDVEGGVAIPVAWAPIPSLPPVPVKALTDADAS